MSVLLNKFVTLLMLVASHLIVSAPISFFKFFSFSIFLAARTTFIPLDAHNWANDALNPLPAPTIKADSFIYDDRCFSASSAAIQPIPAAVTACLKVLSLTSPAAYTPGILVSVKSGLVNK